MSITFMRSQEEPMTWISLPFSTNSKTVYKNAVSQHLYDYSIKATMGTICSNSETSIKLKFPTEGDEAMFMMYISILTDKEIKDI